MQSDQQLQQLNLKRIKDIAEKIPTYNKDINQHIESCRISMDIINQKDGQIKSLKIMVAGRDSLIRRLEEERLMIESTKNTEINQLKEVLAKQYELINEFFSKDG